MRVQAYDSARSDARAEQSYNVKVNRNPSSPVFPTSYTISIKENYPVGGRLIPVNATDGDGVSSIGRRSTGDNFKYTYFTVNVVNNLILGM